MTQRRTSEPSEGGSARCSHDSPTCPAWAARQELERARCEDRAPRVQRVDVDNDPCPHASGLMFALRRRGLQLPPGISTDVWASSIASWMTGRPVRCEGPAEVVAA